MISETLMQKELLRPENGEQFDVIIIGAGPAGMSAAVCAGRAQLKTLVLERALPGGQLSTAYKVNNYIGFPDGSLGEDLSVKMEEHFKAYNIHFAFENVSNILNISAPTKQVQTDMENVYHTKNIIIATGLEPKKLETEFEQKLKLLQNPIN